LVGWLVGWLDTDW